MEWRELGTEIVRKNALALCLSWENNPIKKEKNLVSLCSKWTILYHFGGSVVTMEEVGAVPNFTPLFSILKRKTFQLWYLLRNFKICNNTPILLKITLLNNIFGNNSKLKVWEFGDLGILLTLPGIRTKSLCTMFIPMSIFISYISPLLLHCRILRPVHCLVRCRCVIHSI